MREDIEPDGTETGDEVNRFLFVVVDDCPINVNTDGLTDGQSDMTSYLRVRRYVKIISITLGQTDVS